MCISFCRNILKQPNPSAPRCFGAGEGGKPLPGVGFPGFGFSPSPDLLTLLRLSICTEAAFTPPCHRAHILQTPIFLSICMCTREALDIAAPSEAAGSGERVTQLLAVAGAAWAGLNRWSALPRTEPQPLAEERASWENVSGFRRPHLYPYCRCDGLGPERGQFCRER